MELNVATFLWLRDLGCLSTSHATASNAKGMVVLTTDALRRLQQGGSIVRLLQHYCCERFETPAALQPQESELVAAKRHNWAIVSKILKEALSYDLSWDRRELIIQGDVVEILVLLKQIHDLVKQHRKLDKERQELHRLMCEDPHRLYVQQLVTRPIQPLSPGHPRSGSIAALAGAGADGNTASATSVLSPTQNVSPTRVDANSKPWLVNIRKGPPRRLPPIEEEKKLFEDARRKRSKPLHLDYSQHHNDNAIYRMQHSEPSPRGSKSHGNSPTRDQPYQSAASPAPAPVAASPAAARLVRSESAPPPPVAASKSSSSARPIITDDDL